MEDGVLHHDNRESQEPVDQAKRHLPPCPQTGRSGRVDTPEDKAYRVEIDAEIDGLGSAPSGQRDHDSNDYNGYAYR